VIGNAYSFAAGFLTFRSVMRLRVIGIGLFIGGGNQVQTHISMLTCIPFR
jgi:hypothetical protein